MRKEHVGINLDLSMCAFQRAVETFNDEYGFLPTKLKVGADNIFVEKFKEFAKDELSLPLDIEIDNTFKKCYWEVYGEKDSEAYIIYSNGA